MPLNDEDGDFNNQIEDEDLSIYPPPGVEIGALDLEADRGSGSFAQDGRLEVAEDRTMMNGETQMGFQDDDFEGVDRNYETDVGEENMGFYGFEDELGAASAADRPGSEIGGDFGIDAVGNSGYIAKHGPSEIGNAGYIAQDGPSEIGYGHAPMDGASEIGAGYGFDNLDALGDGEGFDNLDALGAGRGFDNVDALGDEGVGFGGFNDELGAASAADRMASEIGAAAAADRFAAEIGSAAMYGQTEIGAAGNIEPPITSFDLFMQDPTRMGFGGFNDELGFGEFAEDDELGAAAAADRPGSEIFGAEAAKQAVVKVIEKARDNRQPPPPMRAVPVEAPARDDSDDWALTDTFIGAAEASGNADPFPLLSQLMVRAGATTEPRFVRVDTEESYKAFRAQNSPDMAELSARVADLQHQIEAHISDPEAHSGYATENALSEDIEDLTILGAEVDAKEESKRIEMWMPRRFDGLVTAWREGDFVCASLTLPGSDGELRICTSLEPVRKCVAEMSRHAAESGVHAATVVGVLPAMGCVLGAGTALKEMAAAAPAILQRPEAARPAPFMVRIEPKTSPALCALAMLVMACKNGNAQACQEWQNLGALAPPQVKQAMVEALAVAKAAA